MAFYLLIIFPILLSANAQDIDTIENCPIIIEDKVYDALRVVESDGDLCKIEGDKIGPYQISKQYYDEAVQFNVKLLNEGRTWGFVWGKGSKNYSEEVVRNYICRHRKGQQKMIPALIATRHRIGSMKVADMGKFGKMVQRLINSKTLPSDQTEVCDPPCKLGECCKDGKCMCLDTDTLTVEECKDECQAQVVGGLDVVFVLDNSGSIESTEFDSMKQSVINIVSSLTIGPEHTRVAVISFDDEVTLIFNLNSHTTNDSLIEAIESIEYVGGGTNTHLALRLLRESTTSELLGVRPSSESTKVAIVITDGRSTNGNLTRVEAERLHIETDFLVIAVGIGDNTDLDELTNIAGDDNSVIQLESFEPEQLRNLEANIQMETCLAPTPVPPDQPMVVSTLGERAVAYYRVRIPEGGLTFLFDIEEGRVLICGSRNNRNPDCRDPSSYEWRCETNSYCNFHAKSSSRKRRQTSIDFMFVSIEGVEKTNKITMEIMDGDQTISADIIPPTIFTDTVINHNDPLYEVPVIYTPPGMDPTTTSLCFQVHGESGSYYNLISDECIQVNVLYEALENPEDGNFLKEVGILARNNENNCTEIQLSSNRCVPKIDEINFNESYNENGITVVRTKKRIYEITTPNCKATQGDDIIFRIRCLRVRGQKVIRLNVMRGSGIKPGAHGLVGQFWNVPVNVANYTGDYSGPVNNTYVVTVDHPSPNSTTRTFIAELHPATWDRKRKQCLYVGSAQSGAINEVDVPNDHVIEGTYDNYETSDLFASDFQYNRFKEDQCA